MEKKNIIESTKNNTNTKYSTMDTKYHLFSNFFSSSEKEVSVKYGEFVTKKPRKYLP